MIFLIITISFIIWLFNKYYCTESDTFTHQWKYFIDDNLYSGHKLQYRRCEKCNKIEEVDI